MNNIYRFPQEHTIQEECLKKEIKRKKAKKKISQPKKILLGLVVLYLLGVFGNQIYLKWKLEKDIVKLEQTMVALNQKKASLEAKVLELNEEEAIERIAREKLGMVKKGETVVIEAVPGKVKPIIGEYEPGD